jgi:hypothetical protein
MYRGGGVVSIKLSGCLSRGGVRKSSKASNDEGVYIACS